MIGYLEGEVLGTEGAHAIVRTSGGVGYQVTLPAPLLAELSGGGQQVQLQIVTVVRDDEIALYGFADLRSKALFLLLIKVSGIGPRLAVNLLSAYDTPTLTDAILRQDVALLSTIPGIGKKTAGRLCVELGDRLSAFEGTKGAAPEGQGDLVSALTNLGFAEKDVVRTVRTLPNPSAPFADQLRQALALLGKS